MNIGDIDHQVRLATFTFLEEQTALRGDVLPRKLLAQGFQFQGRRVPLLGPQGIFKPAVLSEMPLSITTVPPKPGKEPPYNDGFDGSNLLAYRYRGTDPQHWENVGLRKAMERQAPLVYMYGIVPGEYLPVWPVFVVGDDPASLSFRIAVDDRKLALRTVMAEGSEDKDVDGRRQYATVLARRRMHQEGFRKRVLRAYRERCAICSLKHAELLEAAHILPDTHPKGLPVVPNGISLCKLHHAAFDRQFLGIRPDGVVQLRQDILDEEDGPMLHYGLQGFHDERIIVPRAASMKPDRDFLAERYELFEKAG